MITLNLLFTKITDFGTKLIFAIIVLFIGIKLSKWISKLILKAKPIEKLDDGVKKFASNAAKIALYVITVITAAGILGIPYASFVAVIGSAGVAIGLALQGSLSNIASGILILVTKPFRVGDFIEVGDASGVVQEIGFFSTTIVTGDNKVISYPNSSLASSSITNYSAMETRRVDFNFSVGYSSNIDEVKNILLDCANSHKLVLSDPEPFTAMSEYGDSALVFVLRVWCKSEDYWTVMFDLNESVKNCFDESGIEIPYNKIDVNICK